MKSLATSPSRGALISYDLDEISLLDSLAAFFFAASTASGINAPSGARTLNRSDRLTHRPVSASHTKT